MKSKKNQMYTRSNIAFKGFRYVFLMCFLGLLCGVSLLSAGNSEANVHVVPRVNMSGDILINDLGYAIELEDFVLFGEYKHVSWDRYVWNQIYSEDTATPVLWRVMSTDAAPGPNQKKAILLSNYVLDAKRYNDVATNNTWNGSEVQRWLTNETTGFLQYFTGPDKAALISPSLDGIPGSLITLPSCWPEGNVNSYLTPKKDLVYNGDLCLWFGANDFQGNDITYDPSTYGPNSIARLAAFKGDLYSWDYRTRSPASDYAALVWQIDAYGKLVNAHSVFGEGVGIRPVVTLNLEAVIFKSASDDFAAPVLPVYDAGTFYNPYVLVLPGQEPNGMPVMFASVDLLPVQAEINSKTLTLVWDRAVSQAIQKWPASSDFTLSTGEHPINIDGDPSNPKRLKLTFAAGVAYGDTVDLSYNLNMDAISFDSTGASAKVVNSFSALLINNKTPSGNSPIDPPVPSAEMLSDLLNKFNKVLAPHRVSVLTPFTCTVGTPISMTPNVIAFSKKLTPTEPLEGYKELLPSFTSYVELGRGTVGEVLALNFVINTRELAGFENWKSLNDNERILYLNEQNIIFAYEYADRTWEYLVGAEGFLPWGEAHRLGVVSFTETEIILHYAAIDASGKPWVCSNVLVIPDGVKDNKIIDPVWLMQKKATIMPTQLSFLREKLELEVGESTTVTAVFAPAEATERELLWSVSSADIVRVEKSSEADVYRITGTAEGTVQLRATSSADERVQAAIEVAVKAKGEERHSSGGSGGCNAGASIVILAAWGLLRVISSVRAKKQRY